MKRGAAVLVCLLMVAGLVVMGNAASAGPTSSTTAIVSLGDSFISGEAGRWNGNSTNPFLARNGTDRAARCTWYGDCSYDAHRVYGTSYDNGCHRSDVAHIRSANIAVYPVARDDQPKNASSAAPRTRLPVALAWHPSASVQLSGGTDGV